MIGAKALAKSLLFNNSVTHLDIQDNHMTTEGVRMILQSAVGNGVCHVVKSNCPDDDDDEAFLLKKILHMRAKRRQLKVCIHVKIIIL